MFCALLLVVVFPEVFIRHTSLRSFDQIAEIAGFTFLLLGQLIRVSARGFKAEHSANGRSLIKDGPYMLVRNPMYLGIILIGLGIVLVLFKWWVSSIFLAAFLFRYAALIIKEEKKLMDIFPEDYRDYKKRVPRLLPSLSLLLDKDIAEYLPLKVSWLKKEIAPILIVLLMTIFVESWEDIVNNGLRTYFQETVIIVLIFILFLILAIYLSKRTVALGQDYANKSKSN